VRGSTYTEYMVTVPADISEAVGRLVRAFDPTRGPSLVRAPGVTHTQTAMSIS
jgi:hypothetical protein